MYSSNGFLITEQPRMYLKEFFAPEQWTEIEKSLTEQHTKSPTQKLVLSLILGTLLVGGIILILFCWKKKPKK